MFPKYLKQPNKLKVSVLNIQMLQKVYEISKPRIVGKKKLKTKHRQHNDKLITMGHSISVSPQNSTKPSTHVLGNNTLPHVKN